VNHVLGQQDQDEAPRLQA